MARLPRLYAPGIPQLVQARFARPLATPQDPTPSEPLDLLQQWLAIELKPRMLALHAWTLLPDRLILLATPAQASDIPQVIQGMGRRMAARLTHGRAFEGRYRSALVAEPWIVDCLVWLESCCVDTGFVTDASYWPWSSAAEHVGRRPDGGLLTDHASYWQLADTPFARQAGYRDQLQSGLSQSKRQRIEQALFGQWALGDDDFTLGLRSRASRRAAPAPRGRPRKPLSASVVTK